MNMMNRHIPNLLLAVAVIVGSCNAFSANPFVALKKTVSPSFRLDATTSSTSNDLGSSVGQLKKVLEREYISFFDPMRTEFYAEDVTFDDPLTTLDGVSSYQDNVDMLAGRTLMGKFLFQDAGIILHSVTGGEISSDGKSISDIITRWTLKFTFKGLPWKPTARFSGISEYKVVPSPDKPEGVQITGQVDYWDSINILPGGKYKQVDKGVALKDFLNQIAPGGFQAQTAAPEVPYTLLRRGDGYEVRRYPAMNAVQIPYGRRDEGFGTLGAFARGMNPLAPAVMEVSDDEEANKYMLWPLTYALPGSDVAPEVKAAVEKAAEGGQWKKCEILDIPSKDVAVGFFSDASMGPVVRRADRELRAALERDGLVPSTDGDGKVKFAQYDAIFSMGKRRGEVWVELKEDGANPW